MHWKPSLLPAVRPGSNPLTWLRWTPPRRRGWPRRTGRRPRPPCPGSGRNSPGASCRGGRPRRDNSSEKEEGFIFKWDDHSGGYSADHRRWYNNGRFKSFGELCSWLRATGSPTAMNVRSKWVGEPDYHNACSDCFVAATLQSATRTSHCLCYNYFPCNTCHPAKLPHHTPFCTCQIMARYLSGTCQVLAMYLSGTCCAHVRYLLGTSATLDLSTSVWVWKLVGARKWQPVMRPFIGVIMHDS